MVAGHDDIRPPERDRCSVMALLDLSQDSSERSFLLQRVQPAMAGLMDGSLSTLAPIFAVALATHQPHYAFFAGLASAIGAGVSMGFLGRSVGHRRPDWSR